MAGSFCVFEFPRRSVDGKHEAFSEWDFHFQIILPAHCGRGLSGNLGTFHKVLLPWLAQELDKQNLYKACAQITQNCFQFSFLSFIAMCVPGISKRPREAICTRRVERASSQFLSLPVFLPLHLRLQRSAYSVRFHSFACVGVARDVKPGFSSGTKSHRRSSK